jgi:hypothetical protein
MCPMRMILSFSCSPRPPAILMCWTSAIADDVARRDSGGPCGREHRCQGFIQGVRLHPDAPQVCRRRRAKLGTGPSERPILRQAGAQAGVECQDDVGRHRNREGMPIGPLVGELPPDTQIQVPAVALVLHPVDESPGGGLTWRSSPDRRRRDISARADTHNPMPHSSILTGRPPTRNGVDQEDFPRRTASGPISRSD